VRWIWGVAWIRISSLNNCLRSVSSVERRNTVRTESTIFIGAVATEKAVCASRRHKISVSSDPRTPMPARLSQFDRPCSTIHSTENFDTVGILFLNAHRFYPLRINNAHDTDSRGSKLSITKFPAALLEHIQAMATKDQQRYGRIEQDCAQLMQQWAI
jgi:hypothetical protein